MPLEAPGRLPLRDAIIRSLIGAHAPSGDNEATSYDDLVAAFAGITELLSPSDFQRGELPSSLASIANEIVERGSLLGDEGPVMSALLLLSILEPEEAEHRHQYDLVSRWGREARATRANDFRNASELIDVWQEHARLTPRPDVLETLASLHIARRDLVVQAASTERFNMRLSALSPHLIQRTPFDVAGLFLAHGDLDRAIVHLRNMTGSARMAEQLLQALEIANAPVPTLQGAAALRELAQLYAETRPGIARGVCRFGTRRHPQNGDFPACLARMAARQDDYQTATGWYADAVQAEPGRRALYEEALSALNRFIEAGLFDTDISVARNTANQANDILRAYQERFPDSPSPIRPSRLEFLIGLLEMNSGHPEDAREHLQSSVDLSERSGDDFEDDAARLMASRTFIEALIQLGLVTHRLGDAQGAVPILWRALEQMNRQPGEEINSRQASLFSFLGDALHDAGREQQSQHLYNQSLEAWTGIVDALEGDAQALATAQRGIVLDKLGQSERAIADFESALESGPSTRPTYQAILSHLVTASPRPELARSVFRTAVRELTLEPEWKVYFALWVRIISSRANASLADDVQARLNEHSSGAEWWSKLAAFGAGELEGDSLIELANSAGERAEALFYVAQDRLAAGNRAGASELFEDVLETGMVNFHEYMMTLHVLPELRTTTRNSQE